MRHVDVAGSHQPGKWRKNSVSSSTWMCAPSTSASARMQTVAVAQAGQVGLRRSGRADRRRSPRRCRGSRCWRTGGRAPPPRCSAPCRAAAASPGSPCSRPILAQPPAESPSTRNSSLRAGRWLSQSVSLPGSTATPKNPCASRPSAPTRWRVCAWRMASSAMLLAEVDMLVQPQLERDPSRIRDTRRNASRRSAAPWSGPGTAGRAPWLTARNWRAKTHPPAPASRPWAAAVQFDETLHRVEHAVLQPDSCVPPASVGIRLT